MKKVGLAAEMTTSSASAHMLPASSFAPRFMTDQQLRAYFGLSERALDRLRATRKFPAKDRLINKTDCRSVEIFFDQRSGIASPSRVGGILAAADGKENFNE